MSKEKQIKILIVDDDQLIREAISLMLCRRGCNVREARDGRQALNMIQKSKPDIILLDLKMPVMDGFETYHRLKENPDTSNIPIILCTATPIPAKIKADAYIRKPFSIEEVYAKITKIDRERD